MIDKTRTRRPATDPATDTFLCRSPASPPGSEEIPESEYTYLFARLDFFGNPGFYLRFRPGHNGPVQVRPLVSQDDAAAFILGTAGPDLAGIPEPDRDRIRQLFPGWFRSAGKPGQPAPETAGSGSGPQLPRNTGEGARLEHSRNIADKTVPEPPASPEDAGNRQPVPENAGEPGQSDTGRSGPGESPAAGPAAWCPAGPARSPAYPVILYRSMRHSLATGEPYPSGTDLIVFGDPKDSPRFWFRHWNREAMDRCEHVERGEAARFLRGREPGLFTCWNLRAIREYLPEVGGR